MTREIIEPGTMVYYIVAKPIVKVCPTCKGKRIVKAKYISCEGVFDTACPHCQVTPPVDIEYKYKIQKGQIISCLVLQPSTYYKLDVDQRDAYFELYNPDKLIEIIYYYVDVHDTVIKVSNVIFVDKEQAEEWVRRLQDNDTKTN